MGQKGLCFQEKKKRKRKKTWMKTKKNKKIMSTCLKETAEWSGSFPQITHCQIPIQVLVLISKHYPLIDFNYGKINKTVKDSALKYIISKHNSNLCASIFYLNTSTTAQSYVTN